VISFLPGTYGTSLVRNHSLRGVFEEMEDQGLPSELVEAMKETIDCNLYFFENKVDISTMYIVLCATVALLIGIYVVMNVFKKKVI
jgi:multidrug/hemolysin transport system permease protein